MNDNHANKLSRGLWAIAWAILTGIIIFAWILS